MSSKPTILEQIQSLLDIEGIVYKSHRDSFVFLSCELTISDSSDVIGKVQDVLNFLKREYNATFSPETIEKNTPDIRLRFNDGYTYLNIIKNKEELIKRANSLPDLLPFLFVDDNIIIKNKIELNHLVKDTPLDYKNKIASLIKNISNSPKTDGKKVLFHSNSSGLVIDLDLETVQLEKLEAAKIEKIIKSLDECNITKADHIERNIFNLELINYFKKDYINIIQFIDSFDDIFDLYKKSFKLYSEGFSYTQMIATAEKDIHEYKDKLYTTLHKYNIYLSTSPIASSLVIGAMNINKNISAPMLILIFIAYVLYFISIFSITYYTLSNSINFIDRDVKQLIENISTKSNMKDIIKKLRYIRIVEIRVKIKCSTRILLTILWLSFTIVAISFIYNLCLLFIT